VNETDQLPAVGLLLSFTHRILWQSCRTAIIPYVLRTLQHCVPSSCYMLNKLRAAEDVIP